MFHNGSLSSSNGNSFMDDDKAATLAPIWKWGMSRTRDAGCMIRI